MSATERPWWSTPDGDLDADADVDPVEAHRRARRGDGAAAGRGDRRPCDGDDVDAGPGDDGSWWVPATEAVTRLARDLAATAAGPSAPGPSAAGAAGPAAAGPAGPSTAEATAGGATAEPGERPGDARAGGGGDGGGSHRIDACGVCPICVGLRALGEARPELVAHLAEAARQLALAVRTVVDAAAEGGEAADPPGARRRPRPRRSDGLEHIDLDDG